jgi:hypothetical protein
MLTRRSKIIFGIGGFIGIISIIVIIMLLKTGKKNNTDNCAFGSSRLCLDQKDKTCYTDCPSGEKMICSQKICCGGKCDSTNNYTNCVCGDSNICCKGTCYTDKNGKQQCCESKSQICEDANGNTTCCEEPYVCNSTTNTCSLQCGDTICPPNTTCLRINDATLQDITMYASEDPKNSWHSTKVNKDGTTDIFACLPNNPSSFGASVTATPPAVNNYYPCFGTIIKSSLKDAPFGMCVPSECSVDNPTACNASLASLDSKDCASNGGVWYDILADAAKTVDDPSKSIQSVISNVFPQSEKGFCCGKDDSGMQYNRIIARSCTGTCTAKDCFAQMSQSDIPLVYFGDGGAGKGTCVGLMSCDTPKDDKFSHFDPTTKKWIPDNPMASKPIANGSTDFKCGDTCYALGNATCSKINAGTTVCGSGGDPNSCSNTCVSNLIEQPSIPCDPRCDPKQCFNGVCAGCLDGFDLDITQKPENVCQVTKNPWFWSQQLGVSCSCSKHTEDDYCSPNVPNPNGVCSQGSSQHFVMMNSAPYLYPTSYCAINNKNVSDIQNIPFYKNTYGGKPTTFWSGVQSPIYRAGIASAIRGKYDAGGKYPWQGVYPANIDSTTMNKWEDYYQKNKTDINKVENSICDNGNSNGERLSPSDPNYMYAISNYIDKPT